MRMKSLVVDRDSYARESYTQIYIKYNPLMQFLFRFVILFVSS